MRKQAALPLQSGRAISHGASTCCVLYLVLHEVAEPQPTAMNYAKSKQQNPLTIQAPTEKCTQVPTDPWRAHRLQRLHAGKRKN